MFEPTNFQMYWPRLQLGGPRSGQYVNHWFTSVPASGYVLTTWFTADGCVIADIYQHDSIRTEGDFEAAVREYAVQRVEHD